MPKPKYSIRRRWPGYYASKEGYLGVPDIAVVHDQQAQCWRVRRRLKRNPDRRTYPTAAAAIRAVNHG